MARENKSFFKKIVDHEMKFWKDTAQAYKQEAANLKKLKQIYSKKNIKSAIKEQKEFEKGMCNISQEQYIEEIQSTLLGIMMVLLIVSVIFSYVGIDIARGKSMEPTIKEGNILFFSRYVDDIEEGDIVIVKTNKKMSDESKKVVKRVAKITNTNVYLLGDNRNNSKDSRMYGYVNRNLIEGKVLNYD